MFIQNLATDPRYFFAVVIVVVVSICLHELAHGFAAIRCGDRTAIETGRITMNPLVHMGIFSIIMLFVAGFAWGQMPIDRTRLRGKYAEAFVAVAGPVCNVVIALLALTALGLWMRYGDVARGGPAANAQYLLLVFGIMNFALAIFNMIPWPPLDGSHILANFNPGYARLIDTLSLTGGTIMGFMVIFFFAGKLIFPAAQRLTELYLTAVRGY
jgi:Zn-dependent protease